MGTLSTRRYAHIKEKCKISTPNLIIGSDEVFDVLYQDAWEILSQSATIHVVIIKSLKEHYWQKGLFTPHPTHLSKYFKQFADVKKTECKNIDNLLIMIKISIMTAKFITKQHSA